MTSKVFIFGTSGFAREVDDIAHALGFEGIFVARDQREMHSCQLERVVLEESITKYKNSFFAIGVGDNAIRKTIAKRYAGTLNFRSLIHPTASFGRGQRELIEQRSGVIICAGVRLTNSIKFGDFVIININATIGHDTIIAPFVNVAPGANISGNVYLQEGVSIGTGAAVNQGTEEQKLDIGADTVIGSGSVVVKSCEPRSIYVGVPAKRR